MTRLQAWSERVTREMLKAYWTEPCDNLTLAATNARLVLAREVRALVVHAAEIQHELSAMNPTDEPDIGPWLDSEDTP